MKHEKSVGGIIFREEAGKKYFLLLHYTRINDKKGEHTYWDFPKGHVEESESEVDTLFREIEEETGLKDVKIIEGFREKIKYFFNLKGTLINKEVVFFLCKTHTEQVNISSEHTGFAWLEYKEAEEKLDFKNSKNILTKANEFLGHKKKLTEW
ncbi:MAG: NUDIX domain-containing protein [Candidatus Aenigmarchaeota archaeon]|nr:NUDIX domain-containing protein [Candidatus Aenigmarchaeota archaeon]